MTFKWTFLKFSSIWNLLEFLGLRKRKQRILLGREGEKKKILPPRVFLSTRNMLFRTDCPQNCPLLQSLPRELSWKLGANCGSSFCTWVLTWHFEATWRGLGLSKASAMMPGLTFRQEDVFWPLYKPVEMNLIHLYKWMLCRKEC